MAFIVLIITERSMLHVLKVMENNMGIKHKVRIIKI